MIVRLAFAVIAHVDADVLVIDEALAVGDAFFTQKCMRFLRGFRRRARFSSSATTPGAVLNLCQRALWLHEGVVAQSGPSKPVVQVYLRSSLESAQGLDPTPPAGDSREPAIPGPPAPDDAAPMTFGAGGARIDSVALLGPDGGRRAGRARR